MTVHVHVLLPVFTVVHSLSQLCTGIWSDNSWYGLINHLSPQGTVLLSDTNTLGWKMYLLSPWKTCEPIQHNVAQLGLASNTDIKALSWLFICGWAELHAFLLLSLIKSNSPFCHPANPSGKACIQPQQHSSPVTYVTVSLWSQRDHCIVTAHRPQTVCSLCHVC